jgi:hypothetical protein
LGHVFGLFIYLWHISVDIGQKFCQMFWVIVAENMLWNSAVSDSLDHGGVVARVRKNFAAWGKKLGRNQLPVSATSGLYFKLHRALPFMDHLHW